MAETPDILTAEFPFHADVGHRDRVKVTLRRATGMVVPAFEVILDEGEPHVLVGADDLHALCSAIAFVSSALRGMDVIGRIENPHDPGSRVDFLEHYFWPIVERYLREHMQGLDLERIRGR